jgi:flagellum-specific peptidoglycan hydrolase FlgJ
VDAIKKQFLDDASEQAERAGCIFPTMQACEAALESAYGTSKLATQGRNLFGVKQHSTSIYETLDLPTREFLNGQWVTVMAHWVKYPTLAACFSDRTDTLHRLAPKLPHYASALAANDAETFVREVSKTWSTDPDRADKVLAIHKVYLGL